MALVRRVPSDTLVMVFEGDYRFYPEGEDPDECDMYDARAQNKAEAQAAPHE